MAPEWQNGVDISIGIVHTLQSDLSLLARLRFHALNPLTSTLPFYIVLGTHWALCPPISISKQTVQLGLSLWGSPKERITSFQLSQPRVLSWDEQGALLFVAAIKITISFSIRRGLSLSLSLSLKIQFICQLSSRSSKAFQVLLLPRQSSDTNGSIKCLNHLVGEVGEEDTCLFWRTFSSVEFPVSREPTKELLFGFADSSSLSLSLSLSLSPSEWTTSAELSMSQAKI